jgi:CRISPR/Cas system Type II protein with McrA/HNH and RuvC-like nuclease domain
MTVKSKKEIVLGLDIGPTSVGLASLEFNDKPKLYDKPIIIRFSDACDGQSGKSNNADRRNNRATRRRISRKFRLRHDFLKLCKNEKLFSINENDEDIIISLNNVIGFPYELKLKGMTTELSLEEKIFCLYHYLHHRGYFYESENSIMLLSSSDLKNFKNEYVKKTSSKTDDNDNSEDSKNNIGDDENLE